MKKILIVGAGVVGEATGKGLATAHEVVFVDINPFTIEHLREQTFTAVQPNEMTLTDVHLVIVTVPTPCTDEHGIDTSHLEAASYSIGHALRASTTLGTYPVIVYRSTVTPGTTRDLLIPLLEKTSGLIAHQDFGVCYNPEYLRAHSALADFVSPRLVTIGSYKPYDRAYQMLEKIYIEALGDIPIEEGTYEEAEFHKLVHNAFNATKISFFNEMRSLAKHISIDPERAFILTAKTAEGLWNPNYGIRDFGAYRGACLPKDVNSLLWHAQQHGIKLPILTAVQAVNRALGE